MIYERQRNVTLRRLLSSIPYHVLQLTEGTFTTTGTDTNTTFLLLNMPPYLKKSPFGFKDKRDEFLSKNILTVYFNH